MSFKTHPLLFAVFFSGFLAIRAAATTYYVDINSTNSTPPYANWSTASTNIQNAINATVNGDLVLVSNGIYHGIVITTNAITIQSVNGLGATWIDGDHSAGCASLADGSALTGFTLTNGYAFNGGGANCATTNVFLSNCLIVSNTVWGHYGGGVLNGTLSNCTLLDNISPEAGGAGFATLNNCTLGGNLSSISGGGAYECNLKNCILYNNQSQSGGGAMSSTLNNCIVSNNTAMLTSSSEGGTQLMGGGIWGGTANNCIISYNHVVNQYGDTRITEGGGAFGSALTNCLLFMNTANQYFGGGGGAYGGTLINCTIIANSTYATGGGTYNSTVNNSIIRFNGANYSGGTLNYCVTIPLAPGTGNITNDPVFVNQNANDFNLQSNSPCINSGNNAYAAMATDLDGHPRIVGGTVDVGAYEYQTPKSVISYAWLLQYGLHTDGSADFADLDGTGFNVYQDWIAGLNPTNPASVLVMFSPPPTNNTSGIIVSWQSVSGVSYNLQRSTNLSAQPPFSTIQSNIVGSAGTTSYTDSSATNGAPYFYRVGVP